jgi:hypothetical protein
MLVFTLAYWYTSNYCALLVLVHYCHDAISKLINTIAYQYPDVYSGVLVCNYYNYSSVLVR